MTDTTFMHAKAFISYCQADAEEWKPLSKYLAAHIQTGAITVWNDELTTADRDWRDRLRQELLSVRLAILLVSQHFLASEFGKEVSSSLRSPGEDGPIILPIFLSRSHFKHLGLALSPQVSDPSKPLEALPAEEREHIRQRVAEIVTKAVNAEEDTDMASRKAQGEMVSAQPQDLGPEVEEFLKRWQKKKKSKGSHLALPLETLKQDQEQPQSAVDFLAILDLLSKTKTEPETSEHLAEKMSLSLENFSEAITLIRSMGLVTVSYKQGLETIRLTPKGEEMTRYLRANDGSGN